MKVWRRHGTKPRKSISVVAQFPLAKMNGAISSDITEIWEAQRCAGENQQESQSPPPYEKVLLTSNTRNGKRVRFGPDLFWTKSKSD